MVKRSKKSKSKRVPLKKKYKIIKRVKQHHKKQAKEAKKLGVTKSKVEKDPGIPNDWPFKEQELKNLEARRVKAVEELEAKKAARKERKRMRKLGLIDDDADETALDDESTERLMNDTAIGLTKDNSDRGLHKELAKVIEASDVILEVLDARDPLGTRCIELENMVRKAGAEKRLVLLLNKIDLVPRESVEKWLQYLRQELPAVAFKCSTQEQRSNLGWKSTSKKPKQKSSHTLQTSGCLGAETLIKLLKNYSRSHELKMSITVGVIGLPNVGKSSLINSLKRSHVANVGSTPGLTRSMQEVQLDKNVKLLDCPGVVLLKSSEGDASIALRNCKRIEKLDDPKVPVSEILKRCPAQMLISLYKISAFEGVDDFLFKVGTVRGKLKKGGSVDTDAAARIVLHDWNDGKIPYFTMPPTRAETASSEIKIVSEFGKEFNVDEVYNEESSFIGSLKTLDDLQAAEVPPSNPLSFDESALEDDVEPSLSADQVDSDTSEDDDQPMTDNVKVKAVKKAATIRQNQKLYVAEGILNPKLKKAEKKKKKASKLAPMDIDNDDYDFKVDYSKNSSMDVEEEESGEDNAIAPNNQPSATA